MLIVSGALLAILSASGLLLLSSLPEETLVERTAIPTLSLPNVTATPPRQALIERQAVALVPSSPTPTPSPEPIQTPIPTIAWTDAEKNALSWLCWYEVRGMADARADACLSVISTVRARYAYNSGFGTTDVISTILAEGQFTGVSIDTTRPAPDPELVWIVELYANGARGTCTGYLYFDSIPGGPSLCVIRSGNGQFVEFHNGWH